MKCMLLALMLSVVCLLPQVSMATTHRIPTHEADKRLIGKQFACWARAYERGDAKTVTNIYAPDAVLLLPNTNPIRGRKQLRALFDQLSRIHVTYTYKVDQVEVTGPWAFRWGSAQIVEHRRVTGSDSVRDRVVHLKFIDIWKKGADGIWRIYRDSSVIDKPGHVARKGGANSGAK